MVEVPLYIDLVLVLVYVVAGISLAVVAWSAVRQVRTLGRGVSRLTLITVVTVAALLLLTWLLGSASPLRVGGVVYADATWLRLADMFINSSLLLIVLCSVIIVAAKFRR